VEFLNFGFSQALLELSPKCALRCKHCYVGKQLGFDGDDLNSDDWFKIIDFVSNTGVKKLVFTGGEPLQYKSFYDVLEYGLNHFDDIIVETNGQVVHGLNQYDHVKVAVSFEDATIYRNDLVRGSGAFEMAYHTLQDLQIPKEIRGTVYSNNDVLGMAVMAEKVGADSLFRPFLPTGLGESFRNLLPSRKRIVEVLKQIKGFDQVTYHAHRVRVPSYFLNALHSFHPDIIKKVMEWPVTTGRNDTLVVFGNGDLSFSPLLSGISGDFALNPLRDDETFIYTKLQEALNMDGGVSFGAGKSYSVQDSGEEQENG